MADIRIVKEWLVEADEDFNFASINLEERDRFFARICFHFQQAAEKYLKAYIVAYDLSFKKIHDLTKLLKICQQKDNAFKILSQDTQFLTDFYVDTRYPAVWPVGRTKKEAERAKEAALRVGDFVREKIGGKSGKI